MSKAKLTQLTGKKVSRLPQKNVYLNQLRAIVYDILNTTRFSAVDETLFFQLIELTWPSTDPGRHK